MPSNKFTKVTIRKTDKPELEALQRQLTVRAGGVPVGQATLIHWLIEIAKERLSRVNSK